MPAFWASSFWAARISSSLTGMAVPPLSLKARSTRQSPMPESTRMPARSCVRRPRFGSVRALLEGTNEGSTALGPDDNHARGDGSQSHPSSSSSPKAFHIPTMPVPPPVGKTRTSGHQASPQPPASASSRRPPPRGDSSPERPGAWRRDNRFRPLPRTQPRHRRRYRPMAARPRGRRARQPGRWRRPSRVP